MHFTPLTPDVINIAHERIAPYIHRTPLFSSQHLDEWLGHEIIFKVEALQKTGAFKIRGALNTMLSLKEQGRLPKEVVTFSSGNHAQAVALACRMFDIPSTVFMAKFVSPIKKQATQGYGATVITTENRKEAEERTAEMVENGAYVIHPFDNDMVIAGQGTACYEALQDGAKPTAIFAPCGGGGLASGTYLAAQQFAPDVPVFAGEPVNANDATRSYRSGNIIRYPDSPKTIADGVATPSVSPRTFQYLRQLKGFFEVTEDDIIYWTQWLSHFLKTTVEPTSAVAMGAAHQWLKTQTQKQRALVILTGGNIAPETYRVIWERNRLGEIPPSVATFSL